VGTHLACRYYAEKIAEQGLIGFVLAQSPEYVAPQGATEAIFGTNPVAIAIPQGQGSNPIVFDMATAAIAWYPLPPPSTLMPTEGCLEHVFRHLLLCSYLT